MMTERDQKEIAEILHFWFEEVSPEQKFEADEKLDAAIKERFEDAYWRILRGETTRWRETPEGRLAEIIVLDQFARNIFRGDKQAYAGDGRALSLATEAVVTGADQAVEKKMRLFFYLPYMHSESPEVHEEAMKLFKSLGNEEALEHERQHKAIIDRFGRYPHRNDALGRESTPEEREFLKEHDGF